MKQPTTSINNQSYGLFYYFCLFVIIATTFFVHHYFITVTPSLMQDEALYAWYAKSISAAPNVLLTPELWEAHPPLFAIILQLGNIFDNPLFGYRFVCLLIHLLGIIAIFLLGNKLSGKFLGTLSALILAASPVYYFFANCILNDTALVVCLMFFLLAILNRDPQRTNLAHDFLIGTLGGFAISLKWGGIIVVPILICCFGVKLIELPLKTILQRLLVPVLTLLFFLLCLLTINLLITGNIIAPVSINTFLKGAYYQKSILSILDNFKFMFIPYVILILLAPSLLIAILSKDTNQKSVSLCFLICFLSVALCAEKSSRYSLLFIPYAIILSGKFFEDLLQFLFQKIVFLKNRIHVFIIVILFFIVLPTVSDLIYISKSLSYGFKGLPEAGQWIKARTKPETIVIASSVRQVQYFSNLKRAEYGGNLYYFSHNIRDFQNILKQFPNHHILLELDSWEPRQPVQTGGEYTNQKLKELNFLPIKNFGPYIQHDELNFIVIYERPGIVSKT